MIRAICLQSLFTQRLTSQPLSCIWLFACLLVARGVNIAPSQSLSSCTLHAVEVHPLREVKLKRVIAMLKDRITSEAGTGGEVLAYMWLRHLLARVSASSRMTSHDWCLGAGCIYSPQHPQADCAAAW